jgi:hypothetical protein
MEFQYYLVEFQAQIREINSFIRDFEISFAKGSWEKLWRLVKEVYCKYPNGSPFIGQLGKGESGKPDLESVPFPIHTMLNFGGKGLIGIIPDYIEAKEILSEIKSNSNNIHIGDYMRIHERGIKPQ